MAMFNDIVIFPEGGGKWLYIVSIPGGKWIGGKTTIGHRYYTRSQTGKNTGYRPTLKPLILRIIYAVIT